MDELQARLARALGGQYAVQRELGGGGMSRVFLAEEVALGRPVVVKVLPTELGGGLSLDRFRREIQLAARLQHPHVVPVLTAGEAAGIAYFTMPFVEGRSLRERLNADGALPLRDAVRLLGDVASALAYAHEQGVVHRDIKPDNVLVSRGTAAVTDFGVAKAIAAAVAGDGPERDGARDLRATLTTLGMSLGTPAYMAPEQAAGDPATDHRADLYSFGVLAYELLAGEPPFAGRAPHALVVAHLTEAPPPLESRRPGLPAGLAALVHECLAKDPAVRPQTADAIVHRLDEVAAGVSGGGAGAAAGSAGAAGEPASEPGAERGGPPPNHNIAPAAAPGTTLPTPLVSRRRPALLALAALLAAGTLGAVLWQARSPAATAAADPAAPPSSIAVLPFTNVGGDAQDEYFSDGMTDELTDALARVPGLRVASRTSAFAYKGRSADVRQIARELQVGALLEGRVRRDGDRLRITAQLTSGSDGLVLWSDSYERQMADVFAVQDEIAQAIAGELRPRLAGGGDTAVGAAAGARVRRGTDDLAAYDLYLRGRYHFHRRGEAELRQAAGYFGQAIARDADYAQAHAGLADAAALLPVYGEADADSAFAIARRHAQRAVAIDSTLAEGWTTLGLVHKSVGEWDAGAAAFRRALALDPQSSTARQWYGELLLTTGRVDEAITELQHAEQLDPLSPIIPAELSYMLALAGRHDEARAAAARGVRLGPQLWTSHAFQGFALLFGGRDAEAVASFERAVQLDSTLAPVRGALAFALAGTGDSARARTIAAALEREAVPPSGSALAASFARIGLGDDEAALRWLELAVARRDSWLYAISVNMPLFDRVRATPRFAEVVRRLGLDPAVMTRTAGH